MPCATPVTTSVMVSATTWMIFWPNMATGSECLDLTDRTAGSAPFGGQDIVLDNSGPIEGDGIEKPQGRDRDDDQTGGQTPLLRQMDQIRPGPHPVRAGPAICGFAAPSD